MSGGLAHALIFACQAEVGNSPTLATAVFAFADAGQVGNIPTLTLRAKDGIMRTLSWRAILLLGFVIVMPLLALPAVARRLDDWLYGPPPAEFSQPPHEQQLEQAIEPQVVERASPASFEQVEPAMLASREPHQGLDGLGPSPPPLDPHPAFDRLATASGSAAASSQSAGALDEATAGRLEEIRQQLEGLGADYVRLEVTEGGAYRFYCQIRHSEHASYSRPFEAVSADPVEAGQRVLGEVSAWRTAGRDKKIR